jgi:hypothetical protein
MKKSRFAEPIKVLIEANPAFGYGTVPHLLGLQLEHRTAYLPAQGLADEETSDRLPAVDEDVPLGRARPERAWGD